MPWGFENIPAQYIPKDRGNVFDAIGGVAGSLVDAAGGYVRRQQERELALKRMQQEQGQFDARMGMDQQRMASEDARAQALMQMNKQHNAAQEENWRGQALRDQTKFDAEQAEKAGAARAAPINVSLGQYKDVLDQPEVMPEAAKWNAAADTYRGGGTMMKQTGMTSMPPLQMPEQSPMFDKGFKGPSPTLQMAPRMMPEYGPQSAGEYATARAPVMADAAGQANARMSADKARAAAAGRTSQGDALERIILKGQVDAIIAKAKGGKQLDAMEMMLVDKLGLGDQVKRAQTQRGVDPTNAVPEIRNLRPTGSAPAQNMTPVQDPRPRRTVNGETRVWDGRSWILP